MIRPLALTFLLSLITANHSLNAAEVTIVSDRWYPYNGIPQSPQPGYGIEIARYGLAKGGHTLKYQLMSWERSLELVKEGKKDCVIGAYKREAPDFVYPSLPIGLDQIIFIKRKGYDWQYRGITSLNNIRLGTIPGYEYSPDIKHYITRLAKPENISKTKGKYALEFNLSSLLEGKLDAVVDSKIVLVSTLKKHGWLNEVEIAGVAGAATELYIACSPALKSSYEYAQLISDGIDELRNTGKLNQILDKYGVKDWYQHSNSAALH